MKRLSKKEIKAALDKLKDQKPGSAPPEPTVAKLASKKGGERIRKKGI
jgi:hypothetical protein